MTQGRHAPYRVRRFGRFTLESSATLHGYETGIYDERRVRLTFRRGRTLADERVNFQALTQEIKKMALVEIPADEKGTL